MNTSTNVIEQLREWCALEERILTRALESTRELCDRLNRVLEHPEPEPPPAFALLLSRILEEGEGDPDFVLLRPRRIFPEEP